MMIAEMRQTGVVDLEEQHRVTRQLLGMLDGSEPYLTGGPVEHGVDAYVSEEFAALEERHIFANLPQLVALTCQLPEPGSVITDVVGPSTVVLVRGADGVARAFLNVCRHRGAPVELEQCATRRSLMCPYHGWTYGLDGELLAISDTAAFPGVDPAERGLVQLPLLETGGAIFVHPQPNGVIEQDEGLISLVDGLRGFPLETLHQWRTKEFTYDFNWKLAMETFQETYHFAWLHSTTVGTLLHGNRSHFTPWGNHQRMTIPRRSIDQLRDVAEQDWDALDHLIVVNQAFPNTLVIWLKDHMETWRIYPDPNDHTKCKIRFSFFTPEKSETAESEAHWEVNWNLTMDTVDSEDFLVAAGIQQGMASGAQDVVVYGGNEPGMAHFSRVVRGSVGQA